MTRYFAYGANMDRRHMAETAPTARLLGRATLANHRVTIGTAGYGTLVTAPGKVVHGVLWTLEPADEAALDEFEGLDRGYYQKGEQVVVDQAGHLITAMIYLATDNNPGVAHREYVEQVVAAARTLGFPVEYLADLAALPSADQPGQWIAPVDRVETGR